MKLDAIKFGLASAIAFSIAWIICSIFVMAMPTGMMRISGHMMHGDFSSMQWDLGMSGLIVGLVSWAVVAGVMGWLMATIYNKLLN